MFNTKKTYFYRGVWAYFGSIVSSIICRFDLHDLTTGACYAMQHLLITLDQISTLIEYLPHLRSLASSHTVNLIYTLIGHFKVLANSWTWISKYSIVDRHFASLFVSASLADFFHWSFSLAFIFIILNLSKKLTSLWIELRWINK